MKNINKFNFDNIFFTKTTINNSKTNFRVSETNYLIYIKFNEALIIKFMIKI